MSDDFVLSSKHYRELLLLLKDAESYGKEADKENSKLREYLESAGWGPCDTPACNCNGWHKLRQSKAERELDKRCLDLGSTIASCTREQAEVETRLAEALNSLKDCVFFLDDYLRSTTHPGVSRLVSGAKEVLTNCEGLIIDKANHHE